MGLWLWVDFLGLGCCGFYFGGCGLALRSEFLALVSFFFFFLNNFWVCVLGSGFVFLLFLFKAHLDLNL